MIIAGAVDRSCIDSRRRRRRRRRRGDERGNLRAQSRAETSRSTPGKGTEQMRTLESGRTKTEEGLSKRGAAVLGYPLFPLSFPLSLFPQRSLALAPFPRRSSPPLPSSLLPPLPPSLPSFSGSAALPCPEAQSIKDQATRPPARPPGVAEPLPESSRLEERHVGGRWRGRGPRHPTSRAMITFSRHCSRRCDARHLASCARYACQFGKSSACQFQSARCLAEPPVSEKGNHFCVCSVAVNLPPPPLPNRLRGPPPSSTVQWLPPAPHSACASFNWMLQPGSSYCRGRSRRSSIEAGHRGRNPAG